jgi:acetyl esterase/lipase
MPLDSRVARFLAILAAGNPPDASQTSVAQRRAALTGLMTLGRPEVPIGDTQDHRLPGWEHEVPLRAYTPVGAPPGVLPGLVYFHGGGLVAGSIDTHDAIARSLANAGLCRVISVGYRLGPEHRFPCAVDDAMAAIRHVSARAQDFGIDPTRLGVCGDSAGGTLAAVCCQLLALGEGPRPALQLLLCPILDYRRLTESRLSFGTGYLVDEATLEHDLLHYLPARVDPADPRISPLRAKDLRGMPPTVIHTAEFDPLRDEGRDYCERIQETGTPAVVYCHPGMIHLFYGLGRMIPYAASAIEGIGADIRAALGNEPVVAARMLASTR